MHLYSSHWLKSRQFVMVSFICRFVCSGHNGLCLLAESRDNHQCFRRSPSHEGRVRSMRSVRPSVCLSHSELITLNRGHRKHKEDKRFTYHDRVISRSTGGQANFMEKTRCSARRTSVNRRSRSQNFTKLRCVTNDEQIAIQTYGWLKCYTTSLMYSKYTRRASEKDRPCARTC